jgi:hypothetical protein
MTNYDCMKFKNLMNCYIDRMVIGSYLWLSVPIITKVVSSKLVRGEVYSIQHYVIKFVSDLPKKVSGFLWVLRFAPPKNWLPRYSWNIVESGVKHHNHKPPKYEFLKLMRNQRCLPTLDTVYHIVPLTLLHSICWSEIKDGYHYRKKVKQIPMGN